MATQEVSGAGVVSIISDDGQLVVFQFNDANGAIVQCGFSHAGVAIAGTVLATVFDAQGWLETLKFGQRGGSVTVRYEDSGNTTVTNADGKSFIVAELVELFG